MAKRQTKKIIRDTMSTLLETQGYREITMKDVASQSCDIAASATYKHYRNKAELFKAVLEELLIVHKKKKLTRQQKGIFIRMDIEQGEHHDMALKLFGEKALKKLTKEALIDRAESM